MISQNIENNDTPRKNGEMGFSEGIVINDSSVKPGKNFEIPKEIIIEEKDSGVRFSTGPRRGFGGGGRRFGQMMVEKPKNFKKSFARLVKYLGPHKLKLLLVLCFSALGAILAASAPKITSEAINLIQEGIRESGGTFVIDINTQRFVTLLVTVFIIYLCGALSNFLSAFTVAGISQKVVFSLRNQVKDKLDRLPVKYFDDRLYGETLSRMTNDIETIQTTLQQNITQIINAAFTLLSVTVAMLSINWIVTLVCFATLPLSTIITIVVAKNSQKFFRSQAKKTGEINGEIEEMYSAYKVIKIFNMEESSQRQFDEDNAQLRKYSRRAHFVSGLIMPLLKFVNYINYFVIMLIGAVMAFRQGLRIGDISALIIYSTRFSDPIQTTAQFTSVIQNAIAAAERVFEILDEPEEDAVPATAQLKTESAVGQVAFEAVDFSYSKNSELIRDMNLSLSPGDSVAIVGPTGAGKTTLVNLLMRFYELDKGKICIDGTDITALTRHNLREMYGMVLQDTWLFKGSIKDNILFGNPGATFEEVVDACKKAHAHDFISKMPEGYETLLVEDATNISSGQKQLLTIARALISNPKILILDEATSNVDTRTEQQIQMALALLKANRTSFVIAHRLSTIRNANLILVMNGGKVVEQGTHDELLKKEGFYFELYNSQFNNTQKFSGQRQKA